jgi:hypothetical protein
VADGWTATETEEIIPMAQPDPLDVALEQLAQALADLSVIINTAREFRDKVAPLRPAMVDELHRL